MPRPRLTEVPQKQSPRAPPQLRASSSPSEPQQHRPRTERSPKIAEGRSPSGAQSDPVNKKELGTRIADLESQLGQAQDELKCLKDQLVSAEAAKKVAQEQLEKKSKKQPNVSKPVKIQEKPSALTKTEESSLMNSSSEALKTSDDVEKETDVFEVPIETKTELKPVPDDRSIEMPAISGLYNQSFSKLGSKNEIIFLKSKLEEKGRELELFRQENASLKNELSEKSRKISSVQSDLEELILRTSKADEELEKSKSSYFQINEKLEAAEKAKEELESEMKTLRVQTEQWRKAADAAASVLAGAAEMNGRKISERCGSMDKHHGSSFDRVGGYTGSPGMFGDDPDDVFENGKRKGSAIRMFGDLWKRKGQK